MFVARFRLSVIVIVVGSTFASNYLLGKLGNRVTDVSDLDPIQLAPQHSLSQAN